jgi:tRNA/rRNA methyltransferase
LLKDLSVTLVEPEYSINVGHIARLLKNFGINKLYLIEPKIDLNIVSVFASHGVDVLETVEKIDFKELRKRYELLVGTTAIGAKSRGNVIRTTSNPEQVIQYIRSVKSASIVFGRDTTGLKNEELMLCDVVTTIDTRTKYKTLNISHAVAILLYLLSRQGPSKRPLQPLHVRERFAQYLYELAITSGLQKHRINDLQDISKRISLKSDLNDKEMLLLLSLFRKAILTIRKSQERSNT